MALLGVLLGITMCAVAWAIRYLYIRHRKDRTFRDWRISALESSLVREIASHKEAIADIHKTIASILDLIEPIKSGIGELESKTAALVEEAKLKAPKHIRMRAWNEDAVIPEVTK